ncbi:serine palmitoyltransferase [Auriculariales sp. MPI-PUGE-AT-0066]|nr:serine palmitoyltransferase [Auriculariales sp. MPI-PUGE-AT-0066]
MANVTLPAGTEEVVERAIAVFSYVAVTAEKLFFSIPGSVVVSRYVKSSHQNDPGRTLLELGLFLFALVTLLQSRRQTDKAAKNFIKFTEKEIDDLVDEWTPEPLLPAPSEEERQDLANVPVILGPGGGPRPMLADGRTVLNLTSFNFAGLANNAEIKDNCIKVLREYGLGSCGPPGFYGTIDVHSQLESDIATFLGVESSIIYSQAFAMSSTIIPAFCKKGDVIVADAGVNFGIRKGLQNARSTVRYYRHNDMQALEELLQSMDRDRKKKGAKLTRRFIVTEGVFENDGAVSDLPKLIELKKKYKHRLILDEALSFGVLGAHGRGLTELYGVEAKEVDILCGSLAHSVSACGGFCAGSTVMVEHQRINSAAVVFSAAMPPMFGVAGSEVLKRLQSSTTPLDMMRTNLRAAHDVLRQTRGVKIPSDDRSPVIHLVLARTAPSEKTLTVPEASYFVTEKAPNADELRFAVEEKVLQRVVERALGHGVLITRARRLRGQENPEPRPSIRITISAAMTLEDIKHSCRVVKESVEAVLGEEGLL